MTTTTKAIIPSAGTYRIEAATSAVTFSVKHLFGLQTAKGTMAVEAGEIVVRSPVEQSSVTAVIDATSFRTDKPKRDTHVASATFLDSAASPQITFRSTTLANEAGTWTLHGDLTVRGTTAPVALTIGQVTAQGQGFRIQASGQLDRYAYGVSKMKGMVGRSLDIEISAGLVPTTS